MRHVYIRSILALLWLAVAIASGVSGNFMMAALYVILCILFLSSAYTTWKKGQSRGEDR